MKKLKSLSIDTGVKEVVEDKEEYKSKIREFIEMEKVKLLFRAMQSGLPEQKVSEFLEKEAIADFDLQNFKSRFQIKQAEQ